MTCRVHAYRRGRSDRFVGDVAWTVAFLGTGTDICVVNMLSFTNLRLGVQTFPITGASGATLTIFISGSEDGAPIRGRDSGQDAHPENTTLSLAEGASKRNRGNLVNVQVADNGGDFPDSKTSGNRIQNHSSSRDLWAPQAEDSVAELVRTTGRGMEPLSTFGCPPEIVVAVDGATDAVDGIQSAAFTWQPLLDKLVIFHGAMQEVTKVSFRVICSSLV